jgi:hypothetical protein
MAMAWQIWPRAAVPSSHRQAEPLHWPYAIVAAWLEQRRQIESFFIAEVDRDKVVVGRVTDAR